MGQKSTKCSSDTVKVQDGKGYKCAAKITACGTGTVANGGKCEAKITACGTGTVANGDQCEAKITACGTGTVASGDQCVLNDTQAPFEYENWFKSKKVCNDWFDDLKKNSAQGFYGGPMCGRTGGGANGELGADKNPRWSACAIVNETGFSFNNKDGLNARECPPQFPIRGITQGPFSYTSPRQTVIVTVSSGATTLTLDYAGLTTPNKWFAPGATVTQTSKDKTPVTGVIVGLSGGTAAAPKNNSTIVLKDVSGDGFIEDPDAILTLTPLPGSGTHTLPQSNQPIPIVGGHVKPVTVDGLPSKPSTKPPGANALGGIYRCFSRQWAVGNGLFEPDVPHASKKQLIANWKSAGTPALTGGLTVHGNAAAPLRDKYRCINQPGKVPETLEAADVIIVYQSIERLAQNQRTTTNPAVTWGYELVDADNVAPLPYIAIQKGGQGQWFLLDGNPMQMLADGEPAVRPASVRSGKEFDDISWNNTPTTWSRPLLENNGTVTGCGVCCDLTTPTNTGAFNWGGCPCWNREGNKSAGGLVSNPKSPDGTSPYVLPDACSLDAWKKSTDK